MRNVTFVTVCVMLALALAARADVLVSYGGDYVSANVNCQGLSSGLVPWSMDSLRSPAASYTGPEFYGGAVVDNDGGGSGGWAQWRINNSTSPLDAINTQKATSLQQGDKGTTVPMFKFAASHSLTGATVRINEYQSSQANTFRLVAQAADSSAFYVSSDTVYDADTTFVLDISTLTWFDYDPATSMSAVGAAAAWQPYNVIAVGLWSQNTVGSSGTLGLGTVLRVFEVAGGPPIPEPALLLPLLACVLLRRRAA